MDEAPVGITVADMRLPDEPLVYINEAFERLTGYPVESTLGRNCRFLQGPDTDAEPVARMRQAIEEREPVSVELLNYRKDGEPFWNQVTIAPIRDESDEVTHLVGFQTDITDRKEVELRATRQAEKLRKDRQTREQLLARIDGLVRRVTAATVEATSRTELETRVCEAFVETNDYAAAWFGTQEMTSDRIVSSAQVGCGTDDIRVPMDGSDPMARAIVDRAVTVLDADGIADFPVHARFVGPEGGMAAIPLRYREAEYGVLAVYATESGTLDEHEQAVFEALGKVIGTGLNALQNQRLLTTDEYLELVFEAEQPGPFLLELATEAGCEITYRGTVARPDDQFVLSVLVSGATIDELRTAAGTLSADTELTLVAEYDDASLVEIVAPSESLVRTVLDHNGSIRSIHAADGVADIRLELPRSANPRAVGDTLLERDGGMSRVAQQRKERAQKSRKELVETLRADLTDRQLETVQKAYLSDYFEWPRPVSGEDIADSMGITRSTFHQHLRAAERKPVEAYVDPRSRN
jgi:PAS domain S-box-containing protein